MDKELQHKNGRCHSHGSQRKTAPTNVPYPRRREIINPSSSVRMLQPVPNRDSPEYG